MHQVYYRGEGEEGQKGENGKREKGDKPQLLCLRERYGNSGITALVFDSVVFSLATLTVCLENNSRDKNALLTNK